MPAVLSTENGPEEDAIVEKSAAERRFEHMKAMLSCYTPNMPFKNIPNPSGIKKSTFYSKFQEMQTFNLRRDEAIARNALLVGSASEELLLPVDYFEVKGDNFSIALTALGLRKCSYLRDIYVDALAAEVRTWSLKAVGIAIYKYEKMQARYDGVSDAYVVVRDTRTVKRFQKTYLPHRGKATARNRSRLEGLGCAWNAISIAAICSAVIDEVRNKDGDIVDAAVLPHNLHNLDLTTLFVDRSPSREVFMSVSTRDALKEINECPGYDVSVAGSQLKRRAFAIMTHTHPYGALSHAIILKDVKRNGLPPKMIQVQEEPRVVVCFISPQTNMEDFFSSLFLKVFLPAALKIADNFGELEFEAVDLSSDMDSDMEEEDLEEEMNNAFRITRKKRRK
jgi:hypothetical protein